MADRLATLRAEFQPLARSVLAVLDMEAAKQGLSVRATQALRSWAEQAKLYAKGRTAPGARVTNAAPGTSWHNYGLAFDFGVFTAGGAYLGNHKLYDLLAAKVDALKVPGLVSGRAFADRPHVQFSGSYGLAVPTSVVRQYGTRPFDLPITIPQTLMAEKPADPLASLTPEQRAQWMRMLMEGVFTKHTVPGTVPPVEVLGVFFGRVLDAARRPG